MYYAIYMDLARKFKLFKQGVANQTGFMSLAYVIWGFWAVQSYGLWPCDMGRPTFLILPIGLNCLFVCLFFPVPFELAVVQKSKASFVFLQLLQACTLITQPAETSSYVLVNVLLSRHLLLLTSRPPLVLFQTGGSFLLLFSAVLSLVSFHFWLVARCCCHWSVCFILPFFCAADKRPNFSICYRLLGNILFPACLYCLF